MRHKKKIIVALLLGLAMSVPMAIQIQAGPPEVPNLVERVATLEQLVDTILLDVVPAGTIVMWAGLVEDVPIGWELCDGMDGRPDLTDKFIVGAGNNYDVGDEGGTDEVTLEISNLPTHNHYISKTTSYEGSHTHTSGSLTTSSVSGHAHDSGTYEAAWVPGHRHYFTDCRWCESTEEFPWWPNDMDAANDCTTCPGKYTEYAGDHKHDVIGHSGSAGGHSHSISGATASVPNHAHSVTGYTASTGESTPFAIHPPYYALAFIIKVALE
jgi:microcystin-dependent protein